MIVTDNWITLVKQFIVKLLDKIHSLNSEQVSNWIGQKTYSDQTQWSKTDNDVTILPEKLA